MSATDTVVESLVESLATKLLLYSRAKRWFVAFSGGLDSTVLLHATREVCSKYPGMPALSAIHIDHGLHASSGDWAEHCQRLCDQWEIPLQVHAVAVDTEGASLEDAARRARYYVFEDVVGKKDVIFTGHHLDDQVETFFLRVLRGAGIEGLSAIPEQRRVGKARLARPMLGVSRAQLESYATEYGLDFLTDPANSDTRFDRNYLRHQILPLIEQRWPAYRETVGRCTDHLTVAAERLQALVANLSETSSVMGDLGFTLASLLELAEDMAPASLRKWLKQHNLPMPDTKPLQEFIRQLRESENGTKVKLKTRSWSLQRYADGVYLRPPKEKISESLHTLAPAEALELPGIGKLALVETDGPGLVLPPSGHFDIAFRRGGEHCQPLRREHSATLKQLFQESRIPTWWRARIPLLYAEGELVAAGDLFLCRSEWVAEQSSAPLWQLDWKREVFT